MECKNKEFDEWLGEKGFTYENIGEPKVDYVERISKVLLAFHGIQYLSEKGYGISIHNNIMEIGHNDYHVSPESVIRALNDVC